MERAGGEIDAGGGKHHQILKIAELDRLGQGYTWSQDLTATSVSGSGDSLVWGHCQSRAMTSCFAEE